MLSRRFSFFSPLSRLYCRVVMPDQARLISSVRMAYSLPFSTPRFCHSSVSSLRMRWPAAAVDPLLRIPLFQVGLQGTVDGLLRVDGLLDPLPAHLGQPQLEGLRLGGGNGLDDP